MAESVYSQVVTIDVTRNDDLTYTATLTATEDMDDAAWAVTETANTRGKAIRLAMDAAILPIRLELNEP